MVVAVRRALSFALLLLSLPFLGLSAQAQDAPAFLLLGEDAVGDATFQGQSWPDTWVDINSFSVATVGTDLVFRMGLQGTTTEAGQYCWMAAFQVADEEYVGLDCYEGLAYESDNTLSGVLAPSTSRGTNVASDVSFDEGGVVITVPLDAIGATTGTQITDIYGLTYVTRRLYAADTIPDAKSDVDAEESLGSYVIGGGSLASETIVAAQNITENLTAPSFLHEFTNATSDDYTLSFNVTWANATVVPTAAVRAGSANVTVTHNGTVVYSFLFTNQTHPVPANGSGNATAAGNATSTAGNGTSATGTVSSSGNATSTAGNTTGNATFPAVIGNATGNWTVTIDYEGFVGSLGLNVTEYVAPPPAAAAADVADKKDSPGLSFAIGVGLLAAVAVVLRRRRA